MIPRAPSSCLVGIEAHPVVVEAQVTRGLPGFDIVGLPDRAARECIVRVKAALASTGLELPPKHLVVNVAPSGTRKSSAGLDLPIAVAVASAVGAFPPESFASTFLLAELSLSGELRPVAGALVHLLAAAGRGLAQAIVAHDQRDGARVGSLDVRASSDLACVFEAIRGRHVLARVEAPSAAVASECPDFAEVMGHESAKRALAIAAAGSHATLLSGPPGSGKTMLARRLVSLLPPPNEEESLVLATIASAAGLEVASVPRRPFRAPHHTASAAAVVGGGDPIRPGEVTLAHGGVLFLDELPEFRRDAIESLRTTLEGGTVTITRTHSRVTMPASPLVIGAMNPCPCGFHGDAKRLCTCPQDRVARYRTRISGPILDRFDLHVHVPRQPAEALRGEGARESSEAMRERVSTARTLLAERGAMSPGDIARTMPEDAARLLERAVDRLALSSRVHAKMLRVAKTIAALRNSNVPSAEDVAEALQYRGHGARDEGATATVT